MQPAPSARVPSSITTTTIGGTFARADVTAASTRIADSSALRTRGVLRGAPGSRQSAAIDGPGPAQLPRDALPPRRPRGLRRAPAGCSGTTNSRGVLGPGPPRAGVADDLDVVPLAVLDERGVVGGTVVGTRSGLAMVLAARGQCRGVEGIDLLAVAHAKRVVAITRRLPVARQPEDVLLLRTHPEGGREVEVDLHADGAEHRRVEGACRPEVADVHGDVVEYDDRRVPHVGAIPDHDVMLDIPDRLTGILDELA